MWTITKPILSSRDISTILSFNVRSVKVDSRMPTRKSILRSAPRQTLSVEIAVTKKIQDLLRNTELTLKIVRVSRSLAIAATKHLTEINHQSTLKKSVLSSDEKALITQKDR